MSYDCGFSWLRLGRHGRFSHGHQRGEDVIPIPGTRQEKYLKDNIGAVSLSLSKAELEELGGLVEPAKVTGTRYDEAGMKRVGI
jgi:diketogulonate reductase-like aldo/keto reductase